MLAETVNTSTEKMLQCCSFCLLFIQKWWAV